MSRWIESIRLEDGTFFRLQYHQARMDKACLEVNPLSKPIDLVHHLQTIQNPQIGLFKCRVLYAENIQSVEFIPYTPLHPKTLRVVYANGISYPHKDEDRSQINALFEQRQGCDDILIIKNGLVTDSSHSNIIFFDGNHWITGESPLLNGTMRQMLLDSGQINERPVTPQDIASFKSFRLINAMLGIDGPEIEVSGIVF